MGGGGGPMGHVGAMGDHAMIHGNGRHFAEGPREDHFTRGEHDRFANRGDHERDFDHRHAHFNRHFSEGERDFDHGDRHRVFRNGVWFWTYGPDYYAYGDDCGWLLRRAEVTGSPYWWNRYDACVSYY
jgi:hypothetical protein